MSESAFNKIEHSWKPGFLVEVISEGKYICLDDRIELDMEEAKALLAWLQRAIGEA
jgi:phosphorylcholine metabolism protein LicD